MIGVREKLSYVFRQIGQKLWFLWFILFSEKKKEKKKKKKVTHIVSFDDGDSGQFSRADRSDSMRSYGSPSSLSNVSPSEDSLLGKSKIESSEELIMNNSSTELATMIPGASRDASIASGRSGNFSDSHSRRSQGSFSSADFELR